MSTSTLQNFRVGSDLTVKIRLKDGGVAIDWSTLSGIRAVLYSDAQSSIAGRCDVTVDGEDPTLLVCRYAATKMQYLGVNRIVVSAKYMGVTKTYDKPAFTFVRWSKDQAGEEITIEDPEVTVEISVEDISSSILQEAVNAAFSAADRAEAAAQEAEHMVEIKTGPAGKSPYKGENGNWFEWDEEAGQYVDTGVRAKGDTGDTPDISIGAVTTVEPGEPARATMTGTPEAPVLNLSIPKGAVGSTPNISIGTVTTGAPGTPVVITITGTAEAPVLNVTIPQGMKGDTGVSADYPITIYNGLDSDATDAALSAAQGKVLDGKISQLRQEVDNEAEEGEDITVSAYYPSYNVFNLGVNADGTTDNSGRTSRPFPVKEGDIVTIYKPANYEAYFFSTDANATSYSLLESVPANNQTKSYTVLADGYMAISIANAGDDVRIKIQRDYVNIVRDSQIIAEPTYATSAFIIGVNAQTSSIGDTSSSPNYKHSDYVEVGDFDYIELSVPYIKVKSVAGIVFYDTSKAAVGGLVFSGYNGSFASNDVVLQNIIIPEGVKYVRFTLFADMNGYTQQYSLIGYTITDAYGSGLKQQVEELKDEYDGLAMQVELLSSRENVTLHPELSFKRIGKIWDNTEAGDSSIYWPCIIKPVTPNALGKYYMYYSLDHGSNSDANVGIKMAYSNDLIHWIKYGIVLTAKDQFSLSAKKDTETPTVVWDAKNSRYLMYWHSDYDYGGTPYSQTTYISQSADGINWTYIKRALDIPISHIYGNGHNGYFSVFNVDGIYYGYSLLGGGDDSAGGVQISDDGLSWITIQENKGLVGGGGFRFCAAGRYYLVESRGQAASGTAPNTTNIYIQEVYSDYLTPIGDWELLAEMDSDLGETNNIRATSGFIDNGHIYFVYNCASSDRSTSSFFLAGIKVKED